MSRGGLFSSLLGRRASTAPPPPPGTGDGSHGGGSLNGGGAPATPAGAYFDAAEAQAVAALQLEQQRRQEADAGTIKSLTSQVGDLEATVTQLQEAAAKVEQEARESLSVAHGSLESYEEVRKAESAERLYLRNVLLRYMETEDHTAMFPVVAMCLKLSADEVAKIRDRREERERAKGSAVSRFQFG